MGEADDDTLATGERDEQEIVSEVEMAWFSMAT